MEKNQYCIHSNSERGFWSNVDGWVHDVNDATRFMYDEVFNGDGTVVAPNVMSKGSDACWICLSYGD